MGESDQGMTVIEVVIASALLVLAMGTILGGLARTQQTANFADKRSGALDDLHLAADSFDRDARQAVRVISATATRLEFDQYVGPGVQRSVWEVFGDASGTQLRRTRGSAVRVFLVRITNATVFSYFPSSATPDQIRRVTLFMSARPLQRYPAVNLTTEVTLRNVPLQAS